MVLLVMLSPSSGGFLLDVILICLSRSPIHFLWLLAWHVGMCSGDDTSRGLNSSKTMGILPLTQGMDHVLLESCLLFVWLFCCCGIAVVQRAVVPYVKSWSGFEYLSRLASPGTLHVRPELLNICWAWLAYCWQVLLCPHPHQAFFRLCIWKSSDTVSSRMLATSSSISAIQIKL